MTAQPITAAEFEERLSALCRSAGGAVFPRRPRDRHILFRSAVQSLDTGRDYAELQLNTALREWLAGVGSGLGIDHVTFRRYLVDEGYLVRNASGSQYEVRPSARGQVEFAPEVAAVDSAAVVRAAQEQAAERKRRQTGPAVT
ncbi:MAG: DUF2087 domain-containing protein [Candidatus Latescibacteria bacterium]|nr:DUF2087 domain-containing protein [Candidatus Latescibacterota bacterium]